MVMMIARTGRENQRYENGCRLIAGCVPYKLTEYKSDGSCVESRLQILVVKAQKSEKVLLPKGGWENDETVEEAALREAMEEAGVHGRMGVSWTLSLFDIENVTIIMKYGSTASATTREDEFEFKLNMEVESFIKWLNKELSQLIDERAVLRHFQWPDNKTDEMREVAFNYREHINIVEPQSSSSYKQEATQPIATFLKQMQASQEKIEQDVYNIQKVRDGAIKRCKEFGIPWEWMFDSGIVSQVHKNPAFILHREVMVET